MREAVAAEEAQQPQPNRGTHSVDTAKGIP